MTLHLVVILEPLELVILRLLVITHALVKPRRHLQGHAVVDIRREEGQHNGQHAEGNGTEEDGAERVRRRVPVRSLTRGEDRGRQALHGAQCICAPGRQGQQERRHALCGQTRADHGHRHLRADGGGHPIRENDGVDGGADAARDGP